MHYRHTWNKVENAHNSYLALIISFLWLVVNVVFKRPFLFESRMLLLCKASIYRFSCNVPYNFNMPSFTMQKVIFRTPKGGLLESKRPPFGTLMVKRAGVDDRLRRVIAAEDDKQVAHHSRLFLLVKINDVLVFKLVKSHLYH